MSSRPPRNQATKWSRAVHEARVADALPQQLLYGVFRVAMKRLEQANPRWAADLGTELFELKWSYTRWLGAVVAGKKTEEEMRSWMDKALVSMENRELTKGKGRTGRVGKRQGIESSAEWIASEYAQLLPRLRNLQKEWKTKRDAQKKSSTKPGGAPLNRRTIERACAVQLNQLVWRSGIHGLSPAPDQPSEEIHAFCSRLLDGELPSEIARDILAKVYDLAPGDHLRRLIRRGRKSPDPLRVGFSPSDLP